MNLFFKYKSWYYGLYISYLFYVIRCCLFLDVRFLSGLLYLCFKNNLKFFKVNKRILTCFVKNNQLIKILKKICLTSVYCIMSNDIRRIFLFLKKVENVVNLDLEILCMYFDNIWFDGQTLRVYINQSKLVLRKQFVYKFFVLINLIKVKLLYLLKLKNANLPTIS